MQLLVPPLDDRSADFKKEEDGSSTSNSAAARSVMSQGLQDKFETMKQAWNHHSRASAKRSEAPAEASASSEDQDDAEEEEQHHQNKKRKVAMETAFAIESEVQKWQRGIAELEAMLDVGGDLDAPSASAADAANAARPPEIVRFPTLPPIIPAEEGDFNGSCSSEEEDDEGIEGAGHPSRSNSTKVKVANTKTNNKK